MIASSLVSPANVGQAVSASAGVQALLEHSFSLKMFSGDVWRFTVSELFVLLALVEFIVLKGFSTSAFFLITAMCLFDVVAGYTISIVAAKRDVALVTGNER